MIGNIPLVSVLMTAFNREKYIAEAIESVLASSFRDFELIVVDDASADQTVSIARSYEVRDPRVKVFVNPRNLGDYPNRNQAAGYATGKYLKYLDSDDMLTTHGLETMVNAIEQFPGAAMAMMWVYDDSIQQPLLYSPGEALREFFFKNVWLMVGPSGCIYDTNIFRELGGFSGKQYVSDFEFNLRCANQYPIVKMQNHLIHYRIHEQQQGLESGHSQTYRVWLYRIQQSILSDERSPLTATEIQQAKNQIRVLQARRVLFYFFKSFRWRESLQMVTRSGLGWKDFFSGIFYFKKMARSNN